ncbi:uncharacterized protein JCM6883_002514 [Sporobolomyces salmoneus]|uniref:uncharacterized protein n=1 Tax=Sporobolomyces salmoneus TaxID=183962 RepID=UPI00316EFAF2
MTAAEQEENARFSILRIKRKRTTNQLPLDALVIEQPEPSQKRRKATHVPSSVPTPSTSRADDKLGVSEGVGIFRFAETVSIDSFDDESKTRKVKDRIESFLTRPSPSPAVSNLQQREQRPLARIPSSASLRQSQTPSTSRPSTPTTGTTRSGRKLPSSSAGLLPGPGNQSPRIGSPLPNATSSFPAPAPNAMEQTSQLQRKRTRYRIVPDSTPTLPTTNENDDFEKSLYFQDVEEDLETRRGLRPPRVLSRSELQLKLDRKVRVEAQLERERIEQEETRKKGSAIGGRGRTRIYDAIAEDDDQEDGRSRGKKKMRRESKVKRQEEEGMMENFGEMLKEYLTLQDSTERSLPPLHPPPGTHPLDALDGNTSSLEDEDSATEESSSEFVYDIYYRDLRPSAPVSTSNPTSLSATQESSETGTNSGGGGNGFDVSSLDGLKRIGELAGLEDDEDLLDSGAGLGDSEEEEEDNADQDSNEENDYRNDYPDEESEDEDRWSDDGQDDDDDDDDY